MRLSLILLTVVTVQLSSAATPDTMSEEEAIRQDLLVVAARPDYPYEARRQRWTGSGIFELTFNYQTGNLREVHVVKSTGVRMLDGHAIGALKLWKAKPRSVHNILVPITFILSKH